MRILLINTNNKTGELKMWEEIKKVIHDCLTEDDGVSYCPAKISSFIALFSYLGNTTYSIHTGHAPDLQSFGVGLAAVLSGCGALIAAKQATQTK